MDTAKVGQDIAPDDLANHDDPNESPLARDRQGTRQLTATPPKTTGQIQTRHGSVPCARYAPRAIIRNSPAWSLILPRPRPRLEWSRGGPRLDRDPHAHSGVRRAGMGRVAVMSRGNCRHVDHKGLVLRNWSVIGDPWHALSSPCCDCATTALYDVERLLSLHLHLTPPSEGRWRPV